ncbi:MAG: chemotaxis protein CheD [Bacillota bacterium]|nr:chemotaxis protein CheD [Bacillota bacterium]
MAQSGWCRAPGVLITSGLGSCVGVAIYDPQAKVGGLAHVMLPDSQQARSTENRAKFADTALPDLVEKLEELGARRHRLVVKIAGGAQMFSFSKNDERFSVGRRNVEATKRVLGELGLRITGEDTGGNHGRTMIFTTSDGQVLIKTIGHGEKVL